LVLVFIVSFDDTCTVGEDAAIKLVARDTLMKEREERLKVFPAENIIVVFPAGNIIACHLSTAEILKKSVHKTLSGLT